MTAEDEGKTHEQLKAELSAARRRIEELERTIDELRRVEQGLRRNNEIQSLVLSNDLIGIALVRDRVFAWVNQRFPEMLGMPYERVLGASIRIVFSSDAEYEETRQAAYLAISRGEWFEFHIDVPRPGGGSFTGRVMGRAVNPSAPREDTVWILEDITERKDAEEALKASERSLRAIIDGSPIPAFVIDKDHRVLYWNKALERYSGIAAADVIGTDGHWRAFYAEERPCLADLIVDGGLEDIAHWYAGKHSRSQVIDDAIEATDFFPEMRGGTWLYFTAAPIRDRHGALIGAVETLTDVTERKQSERALWESQRQLADIIDFLPDAIIVIDKTGRVIAWNRATEIMTGVKAEEMLGKGNYEYALPFYGERRPILIDLALRPVEEAERHYESIKWQGDVLAGEAYMPNLRGGRVYTQGTASPLYDTRGAIVGAIETIRDLTERRRMEEALFAEGQRLASILDGTPIPAFFIDRDRRVTLWNRSNETYTGKTKSEMLGKPIDLSFLYRGRNIPSLAEMMLAMTDDEILKKHGHAGIRRSDVLSDALEVIGRIWLRGEERTISTEAIRIIGPGGEVIGVIQTAQDITERLRLETQFRQAQKMEAIGALAGGIAHDFNNILGAIMGYAELGKGQVRDRPKAHHAVEEVLKAAHRAKDLVQQILTFSRRTPQEKRPTAIIPIVKEVAKFIRASLPTTIEIRQRIEARSDVIMADATQMHQVLMNLCTNAGQAMANAGGLLEIGLEEVSVGEGDLGRFSSLPLGRCLKLSVRDTGQGIGPEDMEKLFEPYFTTKEQGEGTGLGLAVVHGIVKGHGGEIEVRSEMGRGSVFEVYLPLLERGPDRGDDDAAIAPPGGRKERILFVDDEEMLTKLGKLFLEEIGYRVVVATDPLQAVEAFKREKDAYDLVITDKTMPRLTGFDVARELRSVRPDIPVILCSGFQGREDLEKQALLGINRFLTKPFSLQTLAEAIRAVLENQGGGPASGPAGE